MFHPGWMEQIRQFGPEAIAAPVNVLRRLAAASSYKGRSSFPTVSRAVVAFTGTEHGTLSPSDRNTLWNAFEVPIFGSASLPMDRCLPGSVRRTKVCTQWKKMR